MWPLAGDGCRLELRCQAPPDGTSRHVTLTCVVCVCSARSRRRIPPASRRLRAATTVSQTQPATPCASRQSWMRLLLQLLQRRTLPHNPIESSRACVYRFARPVSWLGFFETLTFGRTASRVGFRTWGMGLGCARNRTMHCSHCKSGLSWPQGLCICHRPVRWHGTGGPATAVRGAAVENQMPSCSQRHRSSGRADGSGLGRRVWAKSCPAGGFRSKGPVRLEGPKCVGEGWGGTSQSEWGSVWVFKRGLGVWMFYVQVRFRGRTREIYSSPPSPTIDFHLPPRNFRRHVPRASNYKSTQLCGLIRNLMLGGLPWI